MTFQELGLCAPILAALREQGYERPSPIQEKAIPPALQGRDVLGCAQTGTGKTCAFAAPILQQLSARSKPGRPIRSLILTPTRELAIQIDESFASYATHLRSLRHTVIFGGVGQNPQVAALQKGVDILTATPGRLMDLHDQGFVDLSEVEIFVLDEADRMLDMGFIHDVRKILKWLPEKKQTMLFSATMPPEIVRLVDSLLRDPVRVAVDPVSSPVEAIEQSVYLVDRTNKVKLLAHLIGALDVKNALIFTRTKHGANKVARDLGRAGISAAAIHGNKSQTARQQALGDFKAGKLRCLVATDIAARGLDIEELSHVFNYNLPEVPETYVHRIGRTGRAGRAGEAVSFCDCTEKPLLRDIEKLLGRKIPLVEDHPYPMTVFDPPQRDRHGKIINEEDAEARQAAREKHRARAEAVREASEKDAPPREDRAPRAGRPKKRAPAPEERPAEEEPPYFYTPPAERPRLLRPGSLLHTGDAMPCAEFHRPDPLAGDVVMDATARLLSPRRPAHADSGRTGSGHSGGRNRRSGGSGKKQASASCGEQQPRPKDKNTGKKKAAPEKPAESVQKAAGGTGHSSKSGRKRRDTRQSPPQQSPAKREHRPSGGRRGAPSEPLRTHPKDSTEQPSLMKPYYLDLDR